MTSREQLLLVVANLSDNECDGLLKYIEDDPLVKGLEEERDRALILLKQAVGLIDNPLIQNDFWNENGLEAIDWPDENNEQL